MKAMKRKEGQTMVEYIIIMVVIALAALAIFGVLSNTIQEKVSGAAETLGADEGLETQDGVQTLKDLGGD